MSQLVPVMNQYHHDFAAKFGRVMEGHIAEFARQACIAGLSLEDIYRGIQRIPERWKTKPFSPNPMEFVELCKPAPEDFGFPAVEDIYKELERNSRWNERHPCKPFKFSCRAAHLISQDILYEFRMASEEKRWKLIENSYAKWLDIARTTGLPEPKPRLANPEPLAKGLIYARRLGIDTHAPNPFSERIERIKQQRKLSRGAANG